MKTVKLIFLALSLSLLASIEAFPPAPHHMIYGVIKNEQGKTLGTGDATVILSGPEGEVIRGPVDSLVIPGMNYRLLVAQDSGRTPQLYAAKAMMPASPFTIRVLIGSQSYLPIEMQGDLRLLGESGGSTRLDLTLGVDSDGDGLPDAWEMNVIDFSFDDGFDDLSDVNPDDDIDGDGMSNLAEYIAGTYAFDQLDSLAVEIKEVVNGIMRLEFVTITGRSYRMTSFDGASWVEQAFSFDESGEDPVLSHRADSVTVRSVYIPIGTNPVLFRLHVK